jgi:hypothetical protein
MPKGVKPVDKFWKNQIGDNVNCGKAKPFLVKMQGLC